MKRMMKILSICCFIVLITSPGMTGIPLEEGMTPDQVEARFEKMKREQQEIARKIWEEKQKKKKEKDMKEQIIKTMPSPQPLPKEKLPVQKEGVYEAEVLEEKVIPSHTREEAKGIVPGVVTKEKEMEEAIKIEKREKEAQKVRFQRNFSFILVIIVMLATTVFLIRSISQGKPEDEKKKKPIRD